MERHQRHIVCLMILITMLSVSLSAYAQKSYLRDLSFEHTQVVKNGDQVTVSSSITLDNLYLNSQDLIILTPKIKSLEGDQECLLPPIFVAGKTRATVLERERRLHNERAYMTPNPLSITTRRDRSRQSVTYAAQVSYEPWMSAASLSFEEWVMGCAECERGTSSIQVMDRIIYNPKYNLVYLNPKVEPIKSRKDQYVATVNFRVDSDVLEYNYLDNHKVLDEVKEKVANIVHNKDLTVTDIHVMGFASPEASVPYNKELSERRAKAIADFLILKFNLPRQMVKFGGYGEDWKSVRAEIASSDLVDRDKILRIIDTTPDPDARDAQLMELSGGATYRIMLQTIYPRIRRTEYAFSYVVRGFDINEAKQVLRDNPKLLSLNEIYLVAKSYPAGSPEFKEVFDIATRLYPDEPVAIINAAAADIESGNYEDAIRRLLKVKDDPQAWNNLAVAYALKGDDEQAELYFTKAADADDQNAIINLRKFRKVLGEIAKE